MLQSQRPHLFRQVVRVASRDGAECTAASAELRRLVVAVAGLAGALLLINFLVRPINFAAALSLVRARLPL